MPRNPIHRTDADTRAWLILLRAPGLGPATLRNLVAHTGGAAAAFDSFERLHGEFRFEPKTLAWLRAPDTARIEADLAWLDTVDHHLLTVDSPDFPPLLCEIPTPPAALFITGNADLLWLPHIAIVGARSASAGGLANARAFARTLAQAGFTVTSGLAEGVDGAAHTGALEAGGTTVAVVGTGPDLIYPAKHRELSAEIHKKGAIISEFPPGTAARPDHFPRRNRLIAGLSLGTLVVEADLRSGSLITARFAAEQGREVFALPGSIHNPLARGCHLLIRQGAHLVETADEIIATLAPLARNLGETLLTTLETGAPETLARPPPCVGYDRDYARLLAALGHDPVDVDELAERTSLSIAALSSMLLMLELEGEIVSLGSGRYSRLEQR